MSILCIQRTLSEGALIGFATGLGAATVHLSYSAVMLAGGVELTANARCAALLYLASGLVLFWLAARTLRSSKPSEAVESNGQGLTRTYCAAIGLGFANPTTPVFFAATMPALIGNGSSPIALLAFGVFLGSAIWWFFLATGVSIFRCRISAGFLVTVNRVVGLALGALAVAMIARCCASFCTAMTI
jgi:threonine/homoserine/homoserine lactone efflux protein